MEPDDPMTMGMYWTMFLVDIVIYALIVWYLDTVKPGKFGVGRKWYFPFEICITKWRNNVEAEIENVVPDKTTQNSDLFEAYPSGKSLIDVKNLRKVFRSFTGENFIAVDNVTFRAFKGQIMALLGHNG